MIIRLLRIALLLVMVLLLCSSIIAIAGDTGPAEKAVIALFGVGLIVLAPRVRAIGVPRSPSA